MNSETINLTAQDYDLIVELAGVKPCSLEVSPGKDDNWIERAGGGGLPNYVCVVAKGLMKGGRSRSAAIAIAISRIKKWSVGGDGVKADTVAKSVKALAQWNALKARSAAKQVVKASHDNGDTYLMLSAVNDISLDQVREAWQEGRSELRDQLRELYGSSIAESYVPYAYIQEVFLTHVIVSYDVYEASTTGSPGFPKFARIPYTVDNSKVTFGQPIEVELLWVDEANDWRAEARK